MGWPAKRAECTVPISAVSGKLSSATIRSIPRGTPSYPCSGLSGWHRCPAHAARCALWLEVRHCAWPPSHPFSGEAQSPPFVGNKSDRQEQNHRRRTQVDGCLSHTRALSKHTRNKTAERGNSVVHLLPVALPLCPSREIRLSHVKILLRSIRVALYRCGDRLHEPCGFEALRSCKKSPRTHSSFGLTSTSAIPMQGPRMYPASITSALSNHGTCGQRLQGQ